MAALIDSVADLIDVRDKDDLEITLASTLFELAGASALRLWRVIRGDGEVRLRERARIGAPGVKSPVAERALAEMPPCFQAAYQTKLHAREAMPAKAMTRHVFPIADSNDVIGLLELDVSPSLNPHQESVVFGLLRIYRSHLGVLEHGDTDELTGLSNRRPFDETFRRIARTTSCADEANRVRLAIADIDFFKRINDRFGHPYGDEVLVLFGRMMRARFRESDRLFRFGGEEFLMILADADGSQAEALLEGFRAAVAAFAFPLVGRVTVSIGVTEVRPGDTGSAAFGRADEALYAAKRNGRNQVRSYERLVADGELAAPKAVGSDIEMF